jgi:hypothetical protein
VDVGSIGRTTYKLLSCDCVRVASQDPEEELAASNFLTLSYPMRYITLCIHTIPSLSERQQQQIFVMPALRDVKDASSTVAIDAISTLTLSVLPVG